MTFLKNRGLAAWIVVLFAAGPGLALASESAAILKERGARVTYHADTGAVNFIGAGPGAPLASPGRAAGALVQDSAMNHALEYGPLFGLNDPASDLRAMRTRSHPDGRASVRFQQLHKGIPVIAGEIIVGMDRDGNLLWMGGETSPYADLATEPRITEAEARATALTAVAKWYGVPEGSLEASPAELSVYDARLLKPSTWPAQLVWRTEVTNAGLVTIREFVLVDALEGRISLSFTRITDAKNRLTYDGNSGSALPGVLVCN